MKKKHILNITISFILILCLIGSAVQLALASGPLGEEDADLETDTEVSPLECKSALLMEAESGKILYAQNENEPLPPASVTKIMTALLCMEEIAAGRLSLDEMICASAHATEMGGSQIFLKEGESMSVEDMLKSLIIASANDAAVALAERVSGSEEAFVGRMNERASELGMSNTNFENTNGLDDTTQNHLTSALDIAIMTRELCKYEKIFEYSSTWMDTIRDGSFTLTNTNRLVRFYKGATGLKTGSTAKAGFCISATAERNGIKLIAVIMGAESRDTRNECAKMLFDHGFANYSLFTAPKFSHEPLPVLGGCESFCPIYAEEFSALVKKGEEGRVSSSLVIPDSLTAPVSANDKLGEIIYTLDGEELGRAGVFAEVTVEKISFLEVLRRIAKGFLLVG